MYKKGRSIDRHGRKRVEKWSIDRQGRGLRSRSIVGVDDLATIVPDPIPMGRGYTLFQEESIPTGINSENGNQILESIPKYKIV